MKHIAVLIIAALTCVALPVGAHTVGGQGGFWSGIARPQVMYPFKMLLNAHEKTHVVVTGSGGDLDCYLYRGNYQTVTKDVHFVIRDDNSLKDGCDLTVTPDKLGPWLLLVQNQSNHDERYVVNVD